MRLVPHPLGLLIVGAAFVALERRFPFRSGPTLRAGWKVDATHLMLTQTLEILFVVFAVLVLSAPLEAVKVEAVALWVRSQPRWVQVAEVVLLSDFIGYWFHRAEHVVPWLWRFHAVHHSSEQLDWLAAVRRHPMGEGLGRVAMFIPLAWLGFSRELLSSAAGFNGLWALFLHANVRFEFAMIRNLVSTPAFHHWHHARVEGHGSNFAGLFPFWDRLFGTLGPAEGRPATYGTSSAVSSTWVRQVTTG